MIRSHRRLTFPGQDADDAKRRVADPDDGAGRIGSVLKTMMAIVGLEETVGKGA